MALLHAPALAQHRQPDSGLGISDIRCRRVQKAKRSAANHRCPSHSCPVVHAPAQAPYVESGGVFMAPCHAAPEHKQMAATLTGPCKTQSAQPSARSAIRGGRFANPTASSFRKGSSREVLHRSPSDVVIISTGMHSPQKSAQLISCQIVSDAASCDQAAGHADGQPDIVPAAVSAEVPLLGTRALWPEASRRSAWMLHLVLVGSYVIRHCGSMARQTAQDSNLSSGPQS